MIKSENTCQPVHLAPWLPQTKHNSQQLQAIYAQIREICPWDNTRGPQYPTQGLSNENLDRLKTLLTLRKNTTKEIWQVWQNGYKLQRTYLDEKADIEELKGNIKRKQIVININNVEEFYHTYGHIKYILAAQQPQQLTKPSYPTEIGWKSTIDSQESKD